MRKSLENCQLKNDRALCPVITRTPNDLHLSFLTKFISSDQKLKHVPRKSTNYSEVNENKANHVSNKSRYFFTLPPPSMRKLNPICMTFNFESFILYLLV